MGLCCQTPNLAAQATLQKKDVPTGLVLMLFSSLIGAVVFVAVGDNVLSNQLVKHLSGLPGFNKSLITSGGASSLINALPAGLRQAGLTIYNEALRKVFQVALIPSALSVLGAVSLEWRSVKRKPEPKIAAEATGAAEEKKIGETKE